VGDGVRRRTPTWADWPQDGREFTVGVEEEVMLVDAQSWGPANAIDRVLEALPAELLARTGTETHSSAIELMTGVHERCADAIAELGRLRCRLSEVLDGLGLRAGCSGTHPFAVRDAEPPRGERHELVHGSMRSLAQREPTYALHVHVGVPTPAAAMALANQLRAHLPLLLALSSNSPYWQGRDTGLASARTPLWQAFPRVGIPRAFSDYAEYVETVDLLVRAGAFPDHTFLWWDVRLSPAHGTVEVRIMDAQSTLDRTAALVALVQSLARLELTEAFASSRQLAAQELLDENRFLAARDGVHAELIDARREKRAPVAELAHEVLVACAPHAAALGCADELDGVRCLLAESGADVQRRLASTEVDLRRLVEALCEIYASTDVAIATPRET
jgi:glutamate---cysteine ligase / carboxylate-amine ligase